MNTRTIKENNGGTSARKENSAEGKKTESEGSAEELVSAEMCQNSYSVREIRWVYSDFMP